MEFIRRNNQALNRGKSLKKPFRKLRTLKLLKVKKIEALSVQNRSWGAQSKIYQSKFLRNKKNPKMSLMKSTYQLSRLRSLKL